jgi:hypothetical protein
MIKWLKTLFKLVENAQKDIDHFHTIVLVYADGRSRFIKRYGEFPGQVFEFPDIQVGIIDDPNKIPNIAKMKVFRRKEYIVTEHGSHSIYEECE